MPIDKFWNCTFDERGYCMTRTDDKRELRIEDSRVTLIEVPLNGSYPTYAKSNEQKIKMLLEYKTNYIPNAVPPFMLLAAWPGRESQDIFTLFERNVDHYLKRLGWVDPSIKKELDRLHSELLSALRSEQSYRNTLAVRTNQRKRLQKSIRDLENGVQFSPIRPQPGPDFSYPSARDFVYDDEPF